MKVQKISETLLAPETGWTGDKCRCGIFPGVARKEDGSFALLLVSGSDFESSDHRMVAFTGSSDGISWECSGDLGEMHSNDHLFTVSSKPTQLADGRILALGYGFEREKPELSLSDYAEKFGRFPRVRNFVQYSDDGGKSYSGPEFIETGMDGCEFSGPALQLSDGRLLAFGAPFNLEKDGHRGCCFESCDGGHSWKFKSIFFNGGNRAAWECRAAELKDGRIIVVIWVFDLAAQKHLPNHIAVSDDRGKSFQVTDTGLPGQASNLLASEKDADSFYLLQARREGNAPGIYLTECRLDGGKFSCGDTSMIYDAAGGANTTGVITGQFRNLKFGQPALHRTVDGDLLLVFWRYNNDSGRYEVVVQKIKI